MPSRDAITWFTYWDTLPDPPTRFVELLPAFQTASLRTCVRSTISLRHVWEQVLEMPGPRTLTVADVWPDAWLVLFTDGGGGHTVLDEPIAPLAVWLATGIDWMTTQACRFDPAFERWLPVQAARAYWPHFDVTKPPNPERENQ